MSKVEQLVESSSGDTLLDAVLERLGLGLGSAPNEEDAEGVAVWLASSAPDERLPSVDLDTLGLTLVDAVFVELVVALTVGYGVAPTDMEGSGVPLIDGVGVPVGEALTLQPASAVSALVEQGATNCEINEIQLAPTCCSR